MTPPPMMPDDIEDLDEIEDFGQIEDEDEDSSSYDLTGRLCFNWWLFLSLGRKSLPKSRLKTWDYGDCTVEKSLNCSKKYSNSIYT